MNLHTFDPVDVQPARVPTLTEVLDPAAPLAPPTPAEPLPVLVEPVAAAAVGPGIPAPTATDRALPPDPQAVADELARRLAPQLEALVEARLRAASTQVAQALLEHARLALADEVRARVAAAVRDALAGCDGSAGGPAAG
jgi:hypothetical protein